MNVLKVSRFSCQKRLHKKERVNLAEELLEGFSPCIFNRLCVTHFKSSSNGNLDPKSEMVTFFFFKGALKVTVVNSDI